MTNNQQLPDQARVVVIGGGPAGLYLAILISTVLFVLPHYDGNHLPLTQIVGGIVFAIAYEKEKNLIVPIMVHCLGNIAIFSLTFLS